MRKVISLLFLACFLFAIMFVAAEDVGVAPTGEVEDQMTGGCGTVTPGLEDECCQNQGYDVWDTTLNECMMTNEIEPVGGCGAVLDKDACCVNLGYEVWDTTLNECMMESQIDVPKTGEQICCKIYGYGAEMVETNIRYKLTTAHLCSVPEGFVGGNREIVDNSYCRQVKEVKPVPVRADAVKARPIAVQKIIQTRNRLMAAEANGECPTNCVCNEGVMKCRTKNGTKEMVIKAGESGKTIIMVKNSEVKTMAKIYQADDGGVFGVFKGEQTKRIILPDEASEVAKQKLQERVKENQRNRKQIMLEGEEMELNEDGQYDFQAKKRAKLFWIIPVKEKVRMQVDAETGVVIKQRHSWWGFLARDVREDVA